MTRGTALALAAVALADPFVGTGAQHPERGVFGHGGTFPGAVAPFGMLQWTPYTEPSAPGGYDYAARVITGFPITALSGGGCGAFGDVSFMPTPAGASAPFDHRHEAARPGYYRVALGSTRVELTAGSRAGMARITYPAGRAVMSVTSTARSRGATERSARVVGRHVVEGSVIGGEHCGRAAPYRLWYSARFDKPFRRVPGTPLQLRFRSRRVQVRTAISYVSAAGARRNLRSGASGFAAMRRGTARSWGRVLGRVRVRGGSRAARRRLYTGLYHSFIGPTLFSDADGRYRGLDGRVHQAETQAQYTNVSGWDAYRSWAPLLAVVAPRVANDLARSLERDAEQCGAVPRWLLADRETGGIGGDGGTHMLATLDAFGVRDYAPDAALYEMASGAEKPGVRCGRVLARPGLASYLRLGFIPSGEPGGLYGPTSTTLEYASTDFAVAMVARRLGFPAVARRLLGRSRAWRHLLDPTAGLIRPRLPDGRVAGGEETLGPADFVEGNARQYTWLVPQDLRGLIAALGGPAAADRRLDDLLAQLNAGLDSPHAFLGNEPSFLLPWIHNWTGQPWKTEADVRRALDELYTGGPAGLPGNDDQGALSSWSAWAALGLYPAIPGLGGVTVASPLFPRVSIALPHRRRLLIQSGGRGPYVQRVRLNGRPVERAWIPWAALAHGGVLRFSLGPRPSGWGAAAPPP